MWQVVWNLFDAMPYALVAHAVQQMKEQQARGNLLSASIEAADLFLQA